MEVSGEDAQDPGEQEEDLPEGQEESSVGDPDLDPQDRRIRMFLASRIRIPFSFKIVQRIKIMLAK